MDEKNYLPLEKEFDCVKNRHKFVKVENLSVVKMDSKYPLMCLYLMQLGEVPCALCGKVLRLIREGQSNDGTVPNGSWEPLTAEALDRFNSARFEEFKS